MIPRTYKSPAEKAYYEWLTNPKQAAAYGYHEAGFMAGYEAGSVVSIQPGRVSLTESAWEEMLNTVRQLIQEREEARGENHKLRAELAVHKGQST